MYSEPDGDGNLTGNCKTQGSTISICCGAKFLKTMGIV
jgi:hypothetical protein